MSTDNREQQLFPDVIEHYGTDQPPADDAPVSDGLNFPIPTETFTVPDAVIDELDPVVQTELEPIAAEPDSVVQDELEPIAAEPDSVVQDELEPIAAEPDSVVQDELEPIDGEPVIQTELEPIGGAPVDAAEPDTTAAGAPQAYSEWTGEPADDGYVHHDDYIYNDDPYVEPEPADPYADAPDWVQAHIPREPLAEPERVRSGFKPFAGRSRAPKNVDAAPVPVDDVPPAGPADGDWDTTGGEGDGGSRSRNRRLLVLGGAVAAVSVFAAGAVLAFTGGDAETPVPPLPEATTSAASETTAAAPTWCAPVNEPDRIIGNGAGGRDSGPAVIQAFEHAYYVERSGATVASLMLMPSPVPTVQAAIDAVPVGTEHCVTVLPTDDPNRWSVDVLLKMPPLGNEGVHKQWITTAPGEGGLKIVTVEDRK